jgi:hypothetical protein
MHVSLSGHWEAILTASQEERRYVSPVMGHSVRSVHVLPPHTVVKRGHCTGFSEVGITRKLQVQDQGGARSECYDDF